MKRFISIIFTLVLLLPAFSFASASDIDLATLTDKQLTDLAAAIVTEQVSRNQSNTGYIVSGNLGNFFVGLKSAKVDKDSSGDKVVALVFDFSHTDKDSQSFGMSIGTKVFQDGIQCDDSYSYYTTDNNLLKEIKAGPTLEVTRAYIIKSDSPIDVEISELFNFGDAQTLEATVNLD